MSTQSSDHLDSTHINQALSSSVADHNEVKFQLNLEFEDEPPSESPPPIPPSSAAMSSLLTTFGMEEKSESRSVTPISELIQKFTEELQKCETSPKIENTFLDLTAKSSFCSSPKTKDTWNVTEEYGAVLQPLSPASSLSHSSNAVETNECSNINQRRSLPIKHLISSEAATIIKPRSYSVTDDTSTNSHKINCTLPRNIVGISPKFNSHKSVGDLNLNTNFVFQRQPSLLDMEGEGTYTRVFIPGYEKRSLSSMSSNESLSSGLKQVNTNKDKVDLPEDSQGAAPQLNFRRDEPSYSIVFPPLEVPELLKKTSSKPGITSPELQSAKEHQLQCSSSCDEQSLNAPATGKLNVRWKHSVHPELSQRFYTPQPRRKTYSHDTHHRSKMPSIPVKSLVNKFSENNH